VDGVSQTSLERFARQAQKLAGVKGEVSVLIADNRRLRQLNRNFRGKDKATDVLSFPHEGGESKDGKRDNVHPGGDIAISAEIAQENAGRYGHPTTDELKILVLHGMLHLAGYDHETDNGDMQKVEAKLRARLKLPGSLIARAQRVELKAAKQIKRRKTIVSKITSGSRKRSEGGG